MAKKEKTLSILESIRNKMKRIKNTDEEELAGEDEFDSLDDKEDNKKIAQDIIDETKGGDIKTEEKNNTDDHAKETQDEDFDLELGDEDDLNLDENDDLAEIKVEENVEIAAAPVEEAEDDLDLDGESEDPTRETQDEDFDLELGDEDDLNLDENDDLAEIKVEENVEIAAAPVEAAEDDLDLDKELKTLEPEVEEDSFDLDLNEATETPNITAKEDSIDLDHNSINSELDESLSSSILSSNVAKEVKNSIDKLKELEQPNIDIDNNYMQEPPLKSLDDFAYDVIEYNIGRWMDENLSTMVEEIVRTEIKNIIKK